MPRPGSGPRGAGERPASAHARVEIHHGCTCPAPDPGAVAGGPGMFRIFGTASKYNDLDPLQHGIQQGLVKHVEGVAKDAIRASLAKSSPYSMGCASTFRSQSQFRTVDVSKINRGRHNWQKLDTFQTPFGHLGDIEDVGRPTCGHCSYSFETLQCTIAKMLQQTEINIVNAVEKCCRPPVPPGASHGGGCPSPPVEGSGGPPPGSPSLPPDVQALIEEMWGQVGRLNVEVQMMSEAVEAIRDEKARSSHDVPQILAEIRETMKTLVDGQKAVHDKSCDIVAKAPQEVRAMLTAFFEDKKPGMDPSGVVEAALEKKFTEMKTTLSGILDDKKPGVDILELVKVLHHKCEHDIATTLAEIKQMLIVVRDDKKPGVDLPEVLKAVHDQTCILVAQTLGEVRAMLTAFFEDKKPGMDLSGVVEAALEKKFTEMKTTLSGILDDKKPGVDILELVKVLHDKCEHLVAKALGEFSAVLTAFFGDKKPGMDLSGVVEAALEKKFTEMKTTLSGILDDKKPGVDILELVKVLHDKCDHDIATTLTEIKQMLIVVRDDKKPGVDLPEVLKALHDQTCVLVAKTLGEVSAMLTGFFEDKKPGMDLSGVVEAALEKKFTEMKTTLSGILDDKKPGVDILELVKVLHDKCEHDIATTLAEIKQMLIVVRDDKKPGVDMPEVLKAVHDQTCVLVAKTLGEVSAMLTAFFGDKKPGMDLSGVVEAALEKKFTEMKTTLSGILDDKKPGVDILELVKVLHDKCDHDIATTLTEIKQMLIVVRDDKKPGVDLPEVLKAVHDQTCVLVAKTLGEVSAMLTGFFEDKKPGTDLSGVVEAALEKKFTEMKTTLSGILDDKKPSADIIATLRSSNVILERVSGHVSELLKAVGDQKCALKCDLAEVKASLGVLKDDRKPVLEWIQSAKSSIESTVGDRHSALLAVIEANQQVLVTAICHERSDIHVSAMVAEIRDKQLSVEKALTATLEAKFAEVLKSIGEKQFDIEFKNVRQLVQSSHGELSKDLSHLRDAISKVGVTMGARITSMGLGEMSDTSKVTSFIDGLHVSLNAKLQVYHQEVKDLLQAIRNLAHHGRDQLPVVIASLKTSARAPP
ncbi:unnamed protein product [Symbiodinium sp. CCMP2592]|nr:unnamed protein product [Symbiodinium sp. CCMP2592]